MSIPLQLPPISRFNLAESILRYGALFVLAVGLAAVSLTTAACVDAEAVPASKTQPAAGLPQQAARPLPATEPAYVPSPTATKSRYPAPDPTQPMSKALSPTLAGEPVPTNPPPTPTLHREWRLLESTVNGDTMVVDLHMYAGVDVKVDLAGRNPDSVDWTGSTLRHVFRGVPAGRHEVVVYDVMGFVETFDVEVTESPRLLTPSQP